MHLVLPGPPAGLMMLSAMDVAAPPGPLRLTSEELEDAQAIVIESNRGALRIGMTLLWRAGRQVSLVDL